MTTSAGAARLGIVARTETSSMKSSPLTLAGFLFVTATMVDGPAVARAALQQEAPHKKPDPTFPPIDKEKIAARVEAIGRAAVEKDGVPGLSMAVAHDGEILIAGGWGHLAGSKDDAVRADTRYPIGSLTREMTAVAVLQLAEAGKLDLDDAITKHLPEFPAGKRTVTLRQMLSNTSGIPGLPEIERRHPGGLTGAADEAAVMKVFADAPFDFEPGQDFALESANYMLLSMIVAKASGVSFADYVTKNVVQRAGLEHTGFCPAAERAAGFARDCKTPASVSALDLQLAGVRDDATECLCSTVTDLVKWQKALVDRAVFSERSSRLIMSPTNLPDGNTTQYGYALRMSKLGDFKHYAHSGGGNGFRVCLVYYSLPKITIAIVAGCASAPVDRIERDIAAFVLDMPVPRIVPVELPAGFADTCAGEYRIASTRWHVEKADKVVWLVHPDGGRDRLAYTGDATFALENDPEAQVKFDVADGKCVGFTLTRGGFSTVARRMS
jgi:D-alanyl-D-alanine carboxypeptidase